MVEVGFGLVFVLELELVLEDIGLYDSGLWESMGKSIKSALLKTLGKGSNTGLIQHAAPKCIFVSKSVPRA